MDEIQLKRSEQDYYVSTDGEVSDTENDEDQQKISIVSHRIEKGSILYVIKQEGSKSTKTISSEDIDSPLYRNIIADYIKRKAKKSLEKNKLKNQLKYIKGITKVKKEIHYSVVFMDGHEENLSSFEMRQSFQQQLLNFLEKEVLDDA